MEHPTYERIPFVMFSRFTSAIAASTSTQFPDADLRNDTGYDFEIWEVGFHTANQEADSSPAANERPDVWLIKVTDLSRNMPWMKNQTMPAVLIDVSGSGAIGTKWKLRRPTLLPANGNLRVELTNDSSSLTILPRIAFVGFLLVPIIQGTRFDEAVKHSAAAIPQTTF